MKPDELERKAREILGPMRRPPSASSGYRRLAAGRTEALTRLTELIENVPQERARIARKRRVWRGVRLGLLGSLTLAVGSLVWHEVGPAPSATAPVTATLQLLDGQLSQGGTALSAGVDYSIGSLGRVSTSPTSGARFVTNEGVRVNITPGSTLDLDFSPRARHIALHRGKVELSVPQLAPGSSLDVATPDAVVTVHGTRFSVDIKDARTCVEVREGVVSVTREAGLEWLEAGEASGCRSEPQVGNDAVVAAPLPEPPGSSNQPGAPATNPVRLAAPRARSSEARDGGTLTQENRLFERALAAEQARRWQEAEVLARRLLTRYPNSPMVPEARRVLDRVRTNAEAAAP